MTVDTFFEALLNNSWRTTIEFVSSGELNKMHLRGSLKKSQDMSGGFIGFVADKEKAGKISMDDALDAIGKFSRVLRAAGMPEPDDVDRSVHRQAVWVIKEFLASRYPNLKNEIDVLYARFVQETSKNSGRE